jgi:peptidoglycan/xylan/chitin deacetylase (PgdA/CDA1 family)
MAMPEVSANHSCLAVMYHYVRDTAATAFPDIRSLDPVLFARQLDWLQAHYSLIDLAALERAIAGESLLPASAALLTFDDGFVDHYETVFPELRRRGLTGVFFVSGSACGPDPRLLAVHKTHFLLAQLGAQPFAEAVLAECGAHARVSTPGAIFGTDRWEAADDQMIKHLLNYELPFEDAEQVLEALFTRHIGTSAAFARGLYLDERMIEEMARGGMLFGYHTRTHRMLSRLSAADQRIELEAGVAWLRQLTGQAGVPFCYPWGGPQTYTPETVRILGECGYSLAFNTVRRRLSVDRDHRFELPRFDTRDLPPYTTGEAHALSMAKATEEA